MLISIGLPFYNAEQTLADAIRSVFAQTHDDWELILVDDGSTDCSLEIAMAVDDPRVRVYSDDHNKGLSSRLNQIADLARGQFLARMDADDLMHPERLEIQLAYLDGHPHVDVVDSAMCAIDERAKPTGIRGTKPLDFRPTHILRSGLLNHASVVGRTAWFRQHRYDARLHRAEDRELWCRSLRRSSFGRVREPLYFVREASVLSPAKYLRSCSCERRVFRIHGPRLAGRLHTAYLIVNSFARGLFYTACACLRAQQLLARRRNRPLSGVEEAELQASIGRVLDTTVPGLPQHSAHSDSKPLLMHVCTVPDSLGFLAGQSSYARARGYRVGLISSPGKMLRDYGEQERARVFGIPMHRGISPMHDVAALRALCAVFRKNRPAIVHAHTPKAGLLGTIAAWMTATPVRVYHIHGLPFVTSTGLRRMLLVLSDRVACALATQVLCVSHSVRDVVISHGLCRSDKIKVLLDGSINGVDAEARFNPATIADSVRAETRHRFDIPESAIVVGFVGRIVSDKGISELVGAWRDLRGEFPQLHLLLVGHLEQQDPLPPEVENSLHSDGRVHLAGTDWNTPPLYAAMDIVALPTYREGFPSVLLEASAMELPVVATRVPGCVDAVVDGATGTLVRPRDSSALAEAIKRYVTDPSLRAAHGKAGRERVLHGFRQLDMWQALHGEYSRLLSARGIPPPVEHRDEPLEARRDVIRP